VNAAVLLGTKIKRNAQNAKAQGLSSAGKTAAFNKPGKTERKSSFAQAMASKTEEAGTSLEKLQARLAAALKLLQDKSAAESGTLANTGREILEDRALTQKQKTAKLKALVSEAQDRLVQLPAQNANSAALKTVVVKQQPEQGTSGGSTPSEKKRKAVEPSIRIVDLRKGAMDDSAADALKNVSRNTAVDSKEWDSGAYAASGKPASGRNGAGASGRTETGRAAAAGQTPFERFREMAGSELVRNAGLILRNGGGEIRLVLKPESLGSVRLRLNFTDNVIDGKIIVDNPAAKHVLEASLDSLTRALSAEGFQTASLQVSVSGGGADADGAREDAAPIRRMEALQGLSGMVPDAEIMNAWDELLVNLFA
jgi:flagellar hook-length control protein FliK